VAKGEAEVYRPAEACRIAEVAPYVLRYWETEFPSLSEGKDKGATKLYTARDVKMISRIRELLYDEGFTVAGAKKRLEAEIIEGRFDGGLAPAPPIAEQRKAEPAPAARKAEPPAPRAAAAEKPPVTARPISAEPSPGFDRKVVLKELKDIVKLLDRSGKRA
jgi:DNA-binding transcriptional MerR regulator